MNINAEEGSEQDSYRFNPWRAPGSAPVVSACGQAGGKYKQTPVGGDSTFTTNDLATMGDMGTTLKPVPDQLQATWTAGEAVDVSWGMRYNHGGGYQYRLCPADSDITEECFQRMPLEFVKSEHKLLWNNGSLIAMLGEEKGVFVSGVGTMFGPPGVPVQHGHGTRYLASTRTTRGWPTKMAAIILGAVVAATTQFANNSQLSAHKTLELTHCAARHRVGRALTMVPGRARAAGTGLRVSSQTRWSSQRHSNREDTSSVGATIVKRQHKCGKTAETSASRRLDLSPFGPTEPSAPAT